MYLPLFLAIPLLAAGVAIINRWQPLNRALAIGVPAAGFGGGLWLLTHGGDVYVDNVGGFLGGISIPLAADTLTAVMLCATALTACVANWFADAVGETTARFYPALTLVLLAGAWGALMTSDLFNLFVFIEVMLMPSFGLLAMTGTWARLASARMFIVVNLVTSLTLLTGVVFVYAVVGTTNLAALAGAAGPRAGEPWQLWVALGLVLLALCIKAGLAPVHTWLPRSYPATSPAVMALFSGLHTKVAVYAVLRIYMVTFEGDPRWSWIIVGLCIAGMLIGGFGGLAESSMRSVIAYQMVTGIPFMIVALAFLQHDATLILSAALFYMIHHMVVAGALIISAGAIEETYGSGKLRRLSGILRRDPFPAAVFAAAALAIVGLPPFSGLWGKLALVLGIAQEHSLQAWLVIGAIIISGMGALLSMVFVWREVFWGRQMNSHEIDPTLVVNARFVFPALALMIVSLAMFIFAGPMFAITHQAASNLTDTTAYVHAILGDNPVGVVLTQGAPR